MTVVSHKKTVEKVAHTGSGGFLLILGLAAFLAAAWLGWTLGPGWVVHLAAAAEAAWHEYV